MGRSEYPDYHDSTSSLGLYPGHTYMLYPTLMLETVIQHPMDLQTMLRKVKTKSYKNKLEFSDDLNLIWDNCFRYNSTPVSSCGRARFRILKSRSIGSSTSLLRYETAGESKDSSRKYNRPQRAYTTTSKRLPLESLTITSAF